MATNSWDGLKGYLDKMEKARSLASILNYDIQTTCPKEAINEEDGLLEDAFTAAAAIEKDPGYLAALQAAKGDPTLTPVQLSVVKALFNNQKLMEKMSLEEYAKWNGVKNASNAQWRKCRPANDFAGFLPYWEKVIEGEKHVLSLIRTKDNKTLYDVALDQYEPGESEEAIDKIFTPLKAFLIKKIQQVKISQAKRPTIAIKGYDVDRQRHLSLALLNLIHYDFSRGCIRESAHPFSDFTARNDSRITTKFLVDDWRSNAFTCLHEGGHCLQFQNWSKEEIENLSGLTVTAAQCETHSRFYENLIGRSPEFAPLFKKACAETLDPAFSQMSDADFLYLINRVEPGLIRCEADELTYCLHIIIRYEIERDLINGKISCREVPAIWNKKYLDYLGVVVPNDKDGCLQDVHWTDAEIGYFPSYALGNIYGAQILHSMEKSLDVKSLIKENRLDLILAWLRDNDFAIDYLDPDPWIKKISGEGMNPQYYIDYLDKKFA